MFCVLRNFGEADLEAGYWRCKMVVSSIPVFGLTSERKFGKMDKEKGKGEI